MRARHQSRLWLSATAVGSLFALFFLPALAFARERVKLGAWHSAGPLSAKSISDRLFPETAVDLDAREPGGKRIWTAHPEWKDGVVHALPSGGSSTTYLWRKLTAARRVKLTVGLGSDDGLELFLDGKRLITRDVARGVSADQDRVVLDLSKGDHALLFKVYNRGGGHGFWFAAGKRLAARRGWRGAGYRADAVDPGALRLAIEDLSRSFPDRYRRGDEFLRRLDALEARLEDEDADGSPDDLSAALRALRNEALLANPLLAFDRLLFIRRKGGRLGLPQNWQGNCALPRSGWDDELAILSPARPGAEATTFYRPEKGRMVADVDLDFDAGRLLFSMIGSHDRWQIWELGADGSGLRQVTAGTYPDVDNYDACYLPDGRIIFASTRCFQGVPCVGGSNAVANLYRMNADGSGVRQLCFDQDHDWCPAVLNDGRVLYTRWEYSDSPHYFTRLLFSMNPDGTAQSSYYASNSLWPNSTFYARPLPGHPTEVVAVISGHHGAARMGELLLFDPALGRHQEQGAVQRIPGHGVEVKPVITDQLVSSSWPKFLHPWPLSQKYFLVSCQPSSSSPWGIWLVDVFDNMVPIREEPGCALFEPQPLAPRPRPPVIPDAIDLSRRDAVVYISDIYAGDGLAGVPRGAVKKLRVYEPHFAYNRMGGHIQIGIDGPWDVHRILGTVPVEKDGSVIFSAPANTPIAVQPLDAEGRALQLMRSWFTAMPGEQISCSGCHERQNTTPSVRPTIAARRREPRAIDPWYGPARGFSFAREVQPVLDRHCVGCHDGGDTASAPDLRADGAQRWRNFTPSYVALHPYVRRPGPESDYFLQKPLEFHASTSELVQLLEEGHHGVELDAEAWDRLVTWIDLNVPDKGTWHEQRGSHSPYEARRRAMLELFANRSEDLEAEPDSPPSPVAFEVPRKSAPAARRTTTVSVPGWPFGPEEAARRRAAAGHAAKLSLDLGEGESLELALVPAGEFRAGSPDDASDGMAPRRSRVARPFYLGVFEVTNAQYARFDSTHDSAYISMTNKDQSSRGHAINGPRQPVVRVSWNEAEAFCRWLCERSGLRVRLPSETEWEWACRAGTETPFWFGGLDADFSAFANVADRSLAKLARRDSPKWHPRDDRFDDHAMVSTDVGRYQPNPWGIHDLVGNAREWTSSDWRPRHPAGPSPDGVRGVRKVVRGGSWYTRPSRARSSSRLGYRKWQAVFDVGFRVLVEVDGSAAVVVR